MATRYCAFPSGALPWCRCSQSKFGLPRAYGGSDCERVASLHRPLVDVAPVRVRGRALFSIDTTLRYRLERFEPHTTDVCSSRSIPDMCSFVVMPQAARVHAARILPTFMQRECPRRFFHFRVFDRTHNTPLPSSKASDRQSITEGSAAKGRRRAG